MTHNQKNYQYLYAKYKTKYLNLKNQTGSADNVQFEAEQEFLTNNINPSNSYYFKQNLFNYWISSSHNTYLPYGQIFDPASVCYYRLQSVMYHGGCLEIDTDSITLDKKDIIITHLPTNSRSIKLSTVFKIIFSVIEDKIKKSIKSGPIILTFDNKKLAKKEEHMVFWNLINDEFLNKKPNAIVKIDKSFDPSKIPIEALSNKILLRWGENKSCNESTNTDAKVGKDVCPPPKEIISKITDDNKFWMHLKKGHVKFAQSIINERNQTVSISVPLVNKVSDPNQFTISNTQKNLLRIYPHWSSIESGNYDNLKFYRDGVQIVALNLQTIKDAWYLNQAIFLPNTGVPCTPAQTLNGLCIHGWKNSIDNSNPLAYRLKPLWLLGLIPHPEYYNLEIRLINVEKIVDNKLININGEYTNLTFTYGLGNKSISVSELNKSFMISDIDVSVPFFVVEIKKMSSGYKSGVEIPWNIKSLSGNIQFDLHKIRKTKLAFFNQIDLEKNPDDDCINSFLFNTRKQLRLTVQYTWAKGKHIESLIKYNNNIKQLRDGEYKGIKTIEFLNNIALFNEYQDKLSKLISNNGQVIIDEMQLDTMSESQMSDTYYEELEAIDKMKKHNSITSDDAFTDE